MVIGEYLGTKESGSVAYVQVDDDTRVKTRFPEGVFEEAGITNQGQFFEYNHHSQSVKLVEIEDPNFWSPLRGKGRLDTETDLMQEELFQLLEGHESLLSQQVIKPLNRGRR